MALVAHDVSDGTGVDTAVLQRDVGHPQGVVDSHLSPVLPHSLLTAIILDRRGVRNISPAHTQEITFSVLNVMKYKPFLLTFIN